MEATVLAGAIEFSPAEIALILAVLAAASLVITAPGWMVLGVVAGRRVRATASGAARWGARAGGALLGMAVSAGASSLVLAVGGEVIVGVLAAWVACWGVAALLHRSAPAPAAVAERKDATEGWGR